jgi:hypothetical protein
MPTEVTLDGKVYRQIGDIWYDGTSFIRVPKRIARRLDTRLARQRGPVAKVQAKTRRSKPKPKKKGFHQEEVLPVIAGVIRERSADDEYVTHHEIVSALLVDPEGRELAEKAVERRGHTVKRWASWMVQAFSKAISAEESDYEETFERERVDGTWAYRPA